MNIQSWYEISINRESHGSFILLSVPNIEKYCTLAYLSA